MRDATIFIIDELDRCRPNYAVLLLEQIKHFFSVPNIIFILSIDKIQLGNAICGVYGSEKIDTNEYLRRFIDIEYCIPEPDKEKFIFYLYEYFEFDTFFKSSERLKHHEFDHEKDNFIATSTALISNLALRQQEKILAHTRLVLRTLRHSNYSLPTIFVFLSYIKTIHPDFYFKLSNKNLTIKEVQEEYYLTVKPFVTEDTKRLFTQIEAYLLKFFENYKSKYSSNSELYERNKTGSEYSLKIDSKIDNDILLNQLTHYRIMHDLSDFKLSYLIDKLNLTDSIKIS